MGSRGDVAAPRSPLPKNNPMTSPLASSPKSALECWIAQDGTQLAEWAYLFLQELLRDRAADQLAHVALSGGSTPKRLYERMTQNKADATLWERAHWYVSDERNVPIDHADSNFGLADRTLFQPAALSRKLLHPVPINVDAPAVAAAAYEKLIEASLSKRVNGRPAFDLIFLGLGDDAHTASLFPGTSGLKEQTRNVIANHVPKLNTQRITFTAPLINQARAVVFLVSGNSKTVALEQIWHGPRNPDLYPAQLIHGAERVIWMVDRAALGHLEPPPMATHIKQ